MSGSKQRLAFDAATHTYTLDGRRLASVGEVVKRFKPPFDADYWADYKARQRGVSAEVVKAEWAAKRDASCESGTALHEHVRVVVTGGKSRLATSQAVAFNAWWRGARKNLEAVAVETPVWSKALGIAGTPDLIARSRKTGKLHVLDWKTNGEFTTENKYGDRLLPPFDDLPACCLTEYSMQVSLYRVLAEQRHGEAFGDGYVLHVGEKATPHRALALVGRLLAALNGGAA